MNTTEQIFNWKKHPGGVFLIAGPLVLTQVLLMTALAYTHWKEENDPVFAIILAIGAIVAWIALSPMFRLYRDIKKFERENAEREAESERLGTLKFAEDELNWFASCGGALKAGNKEHADALLKRYGFKNAYAYGPFKSKEEADRNSKILGGVKPKVKEAKHPDCECPKGDCPVCWPGSN